MIGRIAGEYHIHMYRRLLYGSELFMRRNICSDPISPDSFQVAGATDLSLFDFGTNDGVVFHGCARHVCPDVFSILLYVPTKHASFMETYIWGKRSYSFNSKTPDNQKYKTILDQLVTYDIPKN